MRTALLAGSSRDTTDGGGGGSSGGDLRAAGGTLQAAQVTEKTHRLLTWAAPLAVATAVAAIVGVRLAGAPVEAYGELGAEWIEHFERVRVAQVWGYDRGLLSFLFAADGAYPPLLHIVTLPFGALVDHRAEGVVWTGLLWLGLLAVGLGLVARGLAPERPRIVAAAAVGALLLPAAHGAAARYYYDLPLTALLWLSAGLVLALGPRRPVAAGVAAGLTLAAAALVKWSAIPLAAPLLLGALLSCRFDGERPVRSRALIAAVLALSFALPTGAYLAGSSRSWTEMMHTFGPEDDAAAAMGEAALRPLRADPKLQAPDRSDRSGGRVERLGWYLRGLLFAVLSPLGAVVLLGLALPWLLRRGPGGWLIGGTVAGQLAFCVLAVPPLDERFVLTLAPALALAAALGWGELDGPRLRAATAAVAIAAGLWIAADFHLGEDVALDPQTTVAMDEPLAGLGLTGSWERRGWGRADRRRPTRLAFREQLWALVEQTGAQRIGRIGGPLIDPFGDVGWWRYRALLGEVQGTWAGQGALELVALCGPGAPPAVGLVLASASRISPIDQPWCPVAGSWAAGVELPGEGQHVGAVAWHPR
jgi:hypothetical protein